VTIWDYYYHFDWQATYIVHTYLVREIDFLFRAISLYFVAIINSIMLFPFVVKVLTLEAKTADKMLGNYWPIG